MQANMTTEQHEINFDSEWQYRCLPPMDVTTIIHSISGHDRCWTPVQLPHLLVDSNETAETTKNHWYFKQFRRKCPDDCPSESIFVLRLQSDDSNEVEIDRLTVWLNNVELFAESTSSREISIPLSTDRFNDTNTLIISSANTSLCLHAFLLLPSAIQIESVVSDTQPIDLQLPLRTNRVLEYLMHFNDADGRVNLSINPKSATSANAPEIVIDADPIVHQDSWEDIHIPRLNIVMLVVGTRGDVQPFIAFGKRLLSTGHRVRLATHEKFRSYVREHQLEFYPLASNPDDLMSFVVKNGGVFPSVSSIIEGDVKKKRRDIAAILASTWKACVEPDDETSVPFRAEVIIANPPSFGHVHCAQKLQIPLHMVFTMPWSATSAFPHAFCKVDCSKASGEKLNLLSYSIIETLTWSGMSDLVNEFRRDILGLPALHTRQGIRILIDERVPHTYCWSPSLVPRPKDWPAHIDVAGYFFLQTDLDNFHPPDTLATFLDLEWKKLSPPIYIGFGSITGNDSHRLLQVILAALRRTGYRAIISGFEKETGPLPPSVFKVSDIPHDWLFQHVAAVCHHGGAGTTAAGLLAGKPSIIVPFFGDQFFWGNVVARLGAGPLPLSSKHLSVDELVEAFKIVHEPAVKLAAQRISEILSKEDGCSTALRMFHSQLPLSRMRSDLEGTFAACYRVDELDLQVSRPVAQVLVATGALDESQFRHHSTKEWASIYDYRAHLPASGALKHTQKAVSHIFLHPAGDVRRAVSSGHLIGGVGDVCKDLSKGIGHLSIGVFSLYGEMTDVLDRVPVLYDRYSKLDAHERPRVTDFKSGAKAAGLSFAHGWKDGLTGFVSKPRVGYHRHGILGGATGALIATANGVVKPTAGSLASVTWLGRGLYASARKNKCRTRKFNENTVIDQLTLSSVAAEENESETDEIPATIRFASVVSGYSPETCQQILDEFEKVKQHQEAVATLSPTSRKTRRHKHHFRRHSDSAL